MLKNKFFEDESKINKLSIVDAGYVQNAEIWKIVVVFPTARPGNKKFMTYIIRMHYFPGNIK